MAETTPTGSPGAPWTAGTAWTVGRRVAVAVGVLVALLVAASIGWLWSLDRSIERVDVEGLGDAPAGGPDPVAAGGEGATAAEEDGGEDAEALTVLVLGSDSREELSRRERRELGTGYVGGERAEVMAITRLDPTADEVRILNVPRDTFVERCDGSIGKANGALQIGHRVDVSGISCTVQTLTAFTGLAIDHVVVVDLAGFVDIVDRLGGVTMVLDQPLQDEDAHLDLPAGCVELDGADALAFVRARHLDDDFGRIARQQRFVQELREEVGAVGVLDDLPRLLGVARAVASSVELDDTLSLGRLQELVREHRATIQGELEGRTVPGTLERSRGVSYLEPDTERLEELTTWLLHGDATEDADGVESDGVDSDEGGGDREAVGDGPVADPGSSADRSGRTGGGLTGGDVAEGGGTRTLSGDAPVASEADGRTGGC